MPPRPEWTVVRFWPFSVPSQHPAGDEPRQRLVGSYDPDCSYHNTLPLSPQGRIEAPIRPPSPPSILYCFAGLCSFEQSIAQPRCIAPLKAEGFTEYPGFVPPPADARGPNNSPRCCAYRGVPDRRSADALSSRQTGFTSGGVQPQFHPLTACLTISLHYDDELNHHTIILQRIAWTLVQSPASFCPTA